MERIIIPGKATYAPVALTDLIVGAPIATRVLLGATAPGQVLAAASFGYYSGSVARDWWARRDVRPINFLEDLGADVFDLQEQPLDKRIWEVQLLGNLLNEGFVADRPPREMVARQVDKHLTAYIASITGQEVVTSTAIRNYTMGRFLMPDAIGACDALSGDIAIFKDVGLLEPHVIAHEFCHRKGYMKELHAQALSYMSMRTSGDPLLVQAARLERIHRQLKIIHRKNPSKGATNIIAQAGLRRELRAVIEQLVGDPVPTLGIMGKIYDQRMRLSGQNGITDYDEGFTNFLWTVRTSTAPHAKPEAVAL